MTIWVWCPEGKPFGHAAPLTDDRAVAPIAPHIVHQRWCPAGIEADKEERL